MQTRPAVARGAGLLAVSLALGRCAAARADETCDSTSLLMRPQVRKAGSGQEGRCRDFARWDGERYTGAEHYSCLTYCQTGWCTWDSYQMPVMENGVPRYVEGVTGLYYTLKQMKRSPFLLPVVDRLGVNDSSYTSAHESVLTGHHWYPWDADYATSVLRASGYSEESFPEFALLRTFRSAELDPPRERVDACQKAGRLLGASSWLMNEGIIRCEDVPAAVRTADKSSLNAYGRNVRRLWDKRCKKSEAKQYRFTCYTSAPQVILWDSNYNAANSNLITPRFNHPWDVACCCCGGGTSKLQPGARIRFKVPPSYESIAAKLTPPASRRGLWARYVDGEGYINTRQKPDWSRRLYPEFDRRAKEGSAAQGAVYTLPTTTFRPEAVSEYPYGPSSSTCSDYTLEEDIMDFALQFKARPKEWADWAGYPCRFNYYQGACKEDGSQDRRTLAAFGALEQYFNGMLKEEIVTAWTFEAGAPDVSVEGMRRADAFKVCCACGGGRKQSGQGPKKVIDMLADSYYFK